MTIALADIHQHGQQHSHAQHGDQKANDISNGTQIEHDRSVGAGGAHCQDE